MNFWKMVAIGCIGYIAGNRVGPGRSYYTSGRYVRRYNNINLKDELIDIFSGKLYQLVYGETRDETTERLRRERWETPADVRYRPTPSYSEYVRHYSNDDSDDESESDESEE